MSGAWNVSDYISAQRMNQKTIKIDTGASILAQTMYAGMLVYPTASSGALAADIPAFRNAANSAFEDILMRTRAQTVTGKTINLTSNTLEDTSNALGDLVAHNGTKFARKARGTAGQVLRVNDGGTDIEYGESDLFRLGSTESVSGVESISLSGLSAKKVMIIFFSARIQNTSGGNLLISGLLRLNNDSGSNYSFGRVTNATHASATTSAIGLDGITIANNSILKIGGMIVISENTATRIKTIDMKHSILNETTPAAPTTVTLSGLWNNTSNQITRIDILHDKAAGSAEILSGSRILAYGKDT